MSCVLGECKQFSGKLQWKLHVVFKFKEMQPFNAAKIVIFKLLTL